MFKTIPSLIMCLCGLASTSANADYAEDVAAINKGMPKQVQQFNSRQIECNHWTGEEPYDNERAAEINAATTKLKCSDLEKDEKNLRKKYKAKPRLIESINKAKAFI